MARVLSIVAVVLSLIAVVVAYTRVPDVVVPEAPPPEARTDRADRGDEADRLNAIEQTLSSLVRRVEALERAPQQALAAGAVAVADPEARRRELAALRSDVDALLTGEALGTEEGRKRFKELVREAQDEVFTDRNRERVLSREANRAERLKRFYDQARLSGTQQADVARLLEEEAARRKALQEQPHTAQSRDEQARLRQQTDEAAKRLLDAEQAKQYDQMRRDERRDFTRPGLSRNRLFSGAPEGR